MDMKDKLITQTTFPYFLGISALLIALCAAFFSVYGIGNLFAGAAFSAMVMASSLEIGKLVATTFLYRYWNKTVGLVKTYLTIAVIALMVITSAGIFGFLSAAYQKSSLTYKLNQEKIVATESSKGYYSNSIATASERIKVLNETRKVQEDRLSTALKDPILTRNAIQLKQIQDQTIKLIDQANEDIKTENNKIEEARTTMQGIDEKVNAMKISGIEKKDIQTFKFLADALGVSLDTVAKWFIVSLIFVFDPLAIALILANNVVVYRKEDERVYDTPPVEESTNSKKPENLEIVDLSEDKKKTQVIVPAPVVVEPTTSTTTTSTTTLTTTNTTPPPEVVEPPKVEEVVNVPVENTSNTVTNPPVENSGDEFFRGMFKK
jgi:hypothetical protein